MAGAGNQIRASAAGRAIAFRSSRFGDRDSPDGLADTAVAPCPSCNKARLEYRRLRHGRTESGAGRGQLQGIITARLKPQRYGAARVAFAVALIVIVAVIARRRMAVTAVADFPHPRNVLVRAGRNSELQRK